MFKTGQELAAASVASEVDSKPLTVRKVGTGGNAEAKQHIRGLLEDVREHAPPDVRDEAVRLLTEFADVFATSDLDLGNFDALEHQIDTADAKPVKQRMRRTPTVFRGEEGHLDKMLAAGVFQPSVSDWASAPVLVRKKDGSVRWCRALNKATVKHTYPLCLIE